jgi:hypothetical protein
MNTRIPRLAASVFAVLVALATVNVATARAEEGDPISTTCGAGTLEECGEKPIVVCDWVIEFGQGLGGVFTIKIGRTNCHSMGSVKIYKNMNSQSALSGSCNALSPLLGMPTGSGCSDQEI